MNSCGLEETPEVSLVASTNVSWMKYRLLHGEGGGLARSGHLPSQTAPTPGQREVHS